MKQLNAKTTKIIVLFLLKLQGRPEKRLKLDGHNDVHIKKGLQVQKENEPGYLLDIGTLLPGESDKYEYQMTFMVIDHRAESGLRLDLQVYPVATNDDANNVTEACVFFKGSTAVRFNSKLQRNLAKKAWDWLHELNVAGYLR